MKLPTPGPKTLLLLAALCCAVLNYAQPIRMLYYKDGSKFLQGRWTYSSNSAFNPDRYNFDENQSEDMRRPLVPIPNYQAHLDKDNLFYPGLHFDGPVMIWHTDGTRRASLIFKQGILHGPYRRYYANGSLAMQGDLENGMPQGFWKSYYRNGKLYQTGTYQPYTQEELGARFDSMLKGTYNFEHDVAVVSQEIAPSPYTDLERYRFMPYQAGLGSKKNGVFTFYDSTGHRMAEEGYLNNIRHGNWNLWRNDTLVLKLEYNMGRLASLTDSLGRFSTAAYEARAKAYLKRHKHSLEEPPPFPAIYRRVTQEPKFPGNSSSTYIQERIHYPRHYKRYFDKTMVVEFYIGEDGNVSDVKVKTPVYGPLDDQVVRIIRSMPSWEPGRLNGVPVRVLYTCYINFGMRVEMGGGIFIK